MFPTCPTVLEPIIDKHSLTNERRREYHVSLFLTNVCSCGFHNIFFVGIILIQGMCHTLKDNSLSVNQKHYTVELAKTVVGNSLGKTPTLWASLAQPDGFARSILSSADYDGHLFLFWLQLTHTAVQTLACSVNWKTVGVTELEGGRGGKVYSR